LANAFNVGNHAEALKTIPQVKLPKTDQVLRAQGGTLQTRDARLTVRPAAPNV
jgi:hypothetical protein